MRRHLADYYATISHLDHEVGRVLAALDQRGWTDNTIVIFSSDQGLAVGGRHGLMGKQNLYEHFKSPLVIAGPDIPHGQSAALVYLFDLYPTVCELARASIPPRVERSSLLPIVLGQQSKVRDWLLCGYRDCQRMLRDERWKLIEYQAADGSHTQLFDLSGDADEINNLADDPRFAAERSRLHGLLRQARQDFDDPVDFASPAPAK
jgi:arylsulfatase A-like enzyme